MNLFLRVILNTLAVFMTLLLVIFAIAEVTSWTSVIVWVVLLIAAYLRRPLGWLAGRIWAGTDSAVDRWERYQHQLTPELSPAIDPALLKRISGHLYLPWREGPAARAAVRALIWDIGQVLERDDLSWYSGRHADNLVSDSRATKPMYIRLRGSGVMLVVAEVPGASPVLLDAWHERWGYNMLDVPQRAVDRAVAFVPEVLAAERDGRRPQRHRRTYMKLRLLVGVAAFIFIVVSFFT